MSVTNNLLELIRDRAFALWESEGKPEGRHEEHWRLASAEFETPPDAPEAVEPARTAATTATAPAPKVATPKAAGRKAATKPVAAANAPKRVAKGRKSAASDT